MGNNSILCYLFLGVQLVFLPAYSPELNPCELVFAQIKNIIRSSLYNGLNGLFEKVILCIISISWENIRNYYQKCINPKLGLLPDLRSLM